MAMMVVIGLRKAVMKFASEKYPQPPITPRGPESIGGQLCAPLRKESGKIDPTGALLHCQDFLILPCEDVKILPLILLVLVLFRLANQVRLIQLGTDSLPRNSHSSSAKM